MGECLTRIFVFIKRVPDTESKIRISEDRKHVLKDELHHINNPYDDYAIEEAVQLKEEYDAEITAISLGSEKNIEVLRRSLAMGVDNAILLNTDKDIFDPSVIAHALAEFTREQVPDIMFFGKQAVDNDNSQVGLIFSELLDLPCIPEIVDLSIENEKVIAKKETDEGTRVIESDIPVVLTAQKGLNEPRLPALIKIMKARKKEIPEKEPELLEEKLKIINLTYPPERSAGKIIGDSVEAVPELVRLLKEEKKVL